MIEGYVQSLLFICLYTFHIHVWHAFRMLKVYFMNIYAPHLTVLLLSQVSVSFGFGFWVFFIYLFYFLCENAQTLWLISCHSLKPVPFPSSHFCFILYIFLQIMLYLLTKRKIRKVFHKSRQKFNSGKGSVKCQSEMKGNSIHYTHRRRFFFFFTGRHIS